MLRLRDPEPQGSLGIASEATLH